MGVDLDKLEVMLKDLKKDMKENFNNLESKVDNIDNRFNNLESKVEIIDNRFNNLESKVEIIDLTQRNSLNLASNYVMDGIDYSPTLKSTGYRTSKKEMTIKI